MATIEQDLQQDDVALADDALKREFYDLSRRAELYGREHAPFWPFEEGVGSRMDFVASSSDGASPMPRSS